jgi:hypothetical protein
MERVIERAIKRAFKRGDYSQDNLERTSERYATPLGSVVVRASFPVVFATLKPPATVCDPVGIESSYRPPKSKGTQHLFG